MKDLKGINYEEYFASGHRACAGCGEALVLRHIMKAAGPKTIVAQATGCMEVVSTPYPQSAWRVPWVHGAFENAAAIASGIDAGLKAQGKREKVNLIAMGGDGASFDIGFGALSGALERGHKFTYIATDNEAYMNCLALDSLIMTKDGLKRIIDIGVGDMVYAFSQKNHKLVLKKCTGIFDNGKKRIFEINTDSQTIKATGNHPFLVLERNGRGKQSELVWKTVEELRAGDEVVVLKQGLEGKSHIFPKIQLSKKGDYKVNRIREVTIPKKSSKDLMKLLGLYVGDGWVRVEKAEIGFSVPKGNRARVPVKQLIRRVFSVDATRENENEVYLGSINAAKFVESLGFGKGAKNKVVPEWVFTLPIEEKKAFIEGLLLSDGYKIGNSYRYVSASKELLQTLRLLLQTMNVRVGKIHQQTKAKGTKVVYRALKKASTYGYICFSLKKGTNSKYRSQNKYRDFLYGNKNFEMKKIRSIERKRLEPTLDLRVEGEHNFIANGFVVHNTGVQRSGATFPYASTTTSPAGKKIPGKQEPKKPLPYIIASHGIKYVASMSPANLLDLKTKVQKALAIPHASFLHAYCVCPVGWHCKSDDTIELSKLAIQTRVFPLYELENGVVKINQKVEKPKPVLEYLQLQGRFKHLGEEEVQKIQDYVDARYKFLLDMDGKKAFDVLF